MRQEAIGLTPDSALLPCCHALPPLAALDIVRLAFASYTENVRNAGCYSQRYDIRGANTRRDSEEMLV